MPHRLSLAVGTALLVLLLPGAALLHAEQTLSIGESELSVRKKLGLPLAVERSGTRTRLVYPSGDVVIENGRVVSYDAPVLKDKPLEKGTDIAAKAPARRSTPTENAPETAAAPNGLWQPASALRADVNPRFSQTTHSLTAFTSLASDERSSKEGVFCEIGVGTHATMIYRQHVLIVTVDEPDDMARVLSLMLDSMKVPEGKETSLTGGYGRSFDKLGSRAILILVGLDRSVDMRVTPRVSFARNLRGLTCRAQVWGFDGKQWLACSPLGTITL